MSAGGKFLRLTLPSLVAGTAGCFIGSLYEKNRVNIFSTVSASVPSITGNDSLGLHKPIFDNGDSNSVSALINSVANINIESISSRHAEIMKYGYPSRDSLRHFDNYVRSYNFQNKTSNWVMEHLTPKAVEKRDRSVDRSNCEYVEDSSIHQYFRSSNADYDHSGYDRGHLAAARNHGVSQHCVDQTFVLSNIAPQVGKGFNRGIWNTLEEFVRYRAKYCKNLWICSGPLYLPKKHADGKKYMTIEVIGKNNVSVPTHFFKALLIQNTDDTFELESYMIENTAHDPDETSLYRFQESIKSIERRSGLLFFHPMKSQTSFKRINGQSDYLDRFIRQKTTSQKKLQARSGG